jgi:protein-S-isoprenylcysteine O-methyltransferase Ste14
MSINTTFVLYFLAFAFIHSLLATDFIKKKVEKKLKDKFRFYRIIYNILTFITAAPAFFVWITSSSSTPLLYSAPEWLFQFFILLRLLALGLLAYAAFQTDLLEFAGLRHSKTEGNLITGGAYGIVRHPLYTGGIVLIFTKDEMTLLDFTAAALVSIYFIAGAYIEERRLVSAFGDAYVKYQQRVSMFIPVKWGVNKIKGAVR